MSLTRVEIRELIETQDMVSGYKDLNNQLQPNGFDLTLDNIFSFDMEGFVFTDKKELPAYNKVKPSYNRDVPDVGLYFLKKGCYLFDINETIKLPNHVCAFTIQRSTIMRCGCITNVGWWDSGYNGKGFSLLTILNEYGFVIERNAKIIQMIFIRNISGETVGYSGSYQHEGVKK
jgi:dUTP pyrophosphatase